MRDNVWHLSSQDSFNLLNTFSSSCIHLSAKSLDLLLLYGKNVFFWHECYVFLLCPYCCWTSTMIYCSLNNAYKLPSVLPEIKNIIQVLLHKSLRLSGLHTSLFTCRLIFLHSRGKNHSFIISCSHLARSPFLSSSLITCMLYFPSLSSGVSSCSFIVSLGSLLQDFFIFPNWVVLIKSFCFLPQLLESTFLFAVIANISTIYKWNYTASAPLLSYHISPRTRSSKFIQAAACFMTSVFKVK